jgi:hypothetical protein
MPGPMVAYDWLARKEKHPVRTESGRWRWISPDPPTADGMADLPEPVFRHLRGDSLRFPWLYRSRARALADAAAAVGAAMADGWRPP